MIDKQDKNKCNGCKMCKDICPKHAISYKTESDGFWFPVVDYNKCINCGLCAKKCPNLTPVKCRTKDPAVYAAWSIDPDIRLQSTSGGIFYELARQVLSEGGYVTGCVYTSDFKGAQQVIIDNMSDLPALMVSKYLQSDTENIYAATKEKLLTGKNVMFVGSPCHAAALVSFLGKEYENLIICDFLCRGTTSPKAHRKYIEWLEDKYGSRVLNLRSKDKRYGWNHFGQAVTFENGSEYFGTRQSDPRIRAYHSNLMCRMACHDCKFKQIPRVGSDLTLADFWGINPDEVDDIEKGISLVLINTDKGKCIFEKCNERIIAVRKTLQDALKGNPSIRVSAPYNKKREKFLQQLDVLPFDKLVAKYTKESLLKKYYSKVKRRVKGVIFK